MPDLRIERKSKCSLQSQLYNQLRQAILEHKLFAGTRLPSTRVLARELGVSRNTVLNTYDSLMADALIVARRGSGTCVSGPRGDVGRLTARSKASFDLWAAVREARFPLVSARLSDPDENAVYIHR